MKTQSLYYLLLLPVALHGTVTEWNGVLPDNITYTDTNINITGNTILGEGTTTIQAFNSDVTIYVSYNSKVYSNDNSQSTLILEATEPYRIFVILKETLEFSGVNNQLYIPLIIEEHGTGSIIWIVQEGKELIFGSGNNRGGTLLKIVYNNGQMPKHIFKPRLHHDQIKFERHCKMGYKEINASGPSITFYAVVDALNNGNDHSGHVQFSDGATIGYERVVIN
ncbi:hypothetical protein EKK58_03695 [Candidatus Dependentiae bacterium]|nr:MAG: hypothetical protein EKK58_03695 [Candidatus Dependentiae bacterium]